jgi:hypothetical protein
MKKKPASKPKAHGVTPAQLKKIALSFPRRMKSRPMASPPFHRQEILHALRAEDNSLVMIVDGMDEAET